MSLRSFTLDDLVRRNALLHGGRAAFIHDGRTVTHAQYAGRVAQLAAGLAGLGVGIGDRVAVLAPNSLEFCDLFGAAARLGAILVPINARLSAEEIAHVIEDVEPVVVIAAAAMRAQIPPAALEGPRLVSIGEAADGWSACEDLYATGSHEAAATIDDDAGLLIVHTAAVGGRARGALLSHAGMMAAAQQAQACWQLGPDDVAVGVLPMFHVAGIGLMLAAQYAGGASLVLPRFDPDALVAAIDQHRGSLMTTFPPMLGETIAAAERTGASLASLRIVTGIDVPETITRFEERCPAARFWVGYGQTETSGMATMSPFRDRPGSAGRPTPLNAVAIVDDTDQPVASGQSGEIVVRGPMVFEGYWRRDADNADTFRGGWHHTGDLGRYDDDGYLWYQGRSPAKELIKPGGENVYPAEVERTLCEHPDILEAVVFGVPDARWGEAVEAACVCRPGTSPDAQQLIEFVGSRIARYKKPARVHFLAEPPRTEAGTIDRTAVKGLYGAS
ncbi:MAG: AMP-binding protein [Burkholderiaceae bacterium]